MTTPGPEMTATEVQSRWKDFCLYASRKNADPVTIGTTDQWLDVMPIIQTVADEEGCGPVFAALRYPQD